MSNRSLTYSSVPLSEGFIFLLLFLIFIFYHEYYILSILFGGPFAWIGAASETQEKNRECVTPGDDRVLEAVTVATVAVAARYIIIYALFSVVWTHFLLYSGGGISSLLCVANALPPTENQDGLWWETDGDYRKTTYIL